MLRVVLFTLLFLVVATTMCQAVTWEVWSCTAYEDDPEHYYYDAITFSFENDVMKCLSRACGTPGGSSRVNYTLLFSGNWAVCGTVDNSNNLVSDPYAKYVYDTGYGGHIEWAPDTPYGYQTPLMLGAMFNGNGAQTYTEKIYNRVVGTETGTLVVWSYLPMRPYEQNFYMPCSNTLYATFVPEPSCIMALLSGLLGVGGKVIISRRKDR